MLNNYTVVLQLLNEKNDSRELAFQTDGHINYCEDYLIGQARQEQIEIHNIMPFEILIDRLRTYT